ncbi:hypothetical protein AB0885_22725 [Streptomyces sp. NPDC005534]|uniref:hypothetical protein n=1 Tax=Streptomyces sp. NPDC005534 TaxID=3155714 RepID=UPI003454A7A6
MTATNTLAAQSGSDVFKWLAVASYGLLVLAWVVVAGRSALHAAGHMRRRVVAGHGYRPLGAAAAVDRPAALTGTVRAGAGARAVAEAAATPLDPAGEVVGVTPTADSEG